MTAATDRLRLSGPINGTGGLVRDAANLGTVVLSGSDSYAGGTTVSAGELIVAAGAAMPSRNNWNLILPGCRGRLSRAWICRGGRLSLVRLSDSIKKSYRFRDSQA